MCLIPKRPGYFQGTTLIIVVPSIQMQSFTKKKHVKHKFEFSNPSELGSFP